MKTDNILDNDIVPQFVYTSKIAGDIALTPHLTCGALLDYDKRTDGRLFYNIRRVFQDKNYLSGLGNVQRILLILFPDMECAANFIYVTIEDQLPDNVKASIGRNMRVFLDGLTPKQLGIAISGVSTTILNFFREVDGSFRRPAVKAGEATGVDGGVNTTSIDSQGLSV